MQQTSFLQRHGRHLWRAATLALLLAAATCLIVNVATSGALTWAWYSILSIAFAGVLETMFFLGGKRRLQYTFGALALLVFPFLMLLDRVTPVHGWARAIGFPVAGVSILYLAAVYAVLRHTRWNWWVRIGVIVLGSIPVSLVSQFAAMRFVGQPMHWSNLINVVSCAALATVCFVLSRRNAKKRPA